MFANRTLLKMKLNLRLLLVLSAGLVIGSQAFALAQVRSLSAETYEKSETQYVISNNTKTEVSCNQGDELVTGDCTVTNAREFPNSLIHGVKVESSYTEKSAWACQVQILDPRLDIRLISSVTCKKSDKKS